MCTSVAFQSQILYVVNQSCRTLCAALYSSHTSFHCFVLYSKFASSLHFSYNGFDSICICLLCFCYNLALNLNP